MQMKQQQKITRHEALLRSYRNINKHQTENISFHVKIDDSKFISYKLLNANAAK